MEKIIILLIKIWLNWKTFGWFYLIMVDGFSSKISIKIITLACFSLFNNNGNKYKQSQDDYKVLRQSQN